MFITHFLTSPEIPNRVDMNSDPEDVGQSPEQRSRSLLRKLYHQDRRPWVVAFSGGKDSTVLLQLVYSLLLDLNNKDRKPVFVVASDTGVEAPNVSAYLADTLTAIRASTRDALPNLTVHLVKPQVDQTFWSKLIGQGYPSPTRWFRWCTTNMKIKPSRRLIEGITRRHKGCSLNSCAFSVIRSSLAWPIYSSLLYKL